jgi:hypothetical protein
MKIGEGAFAEAADGEMPLGLPRLTEVFDGPQTTQGGIEESQQVCDDNVVKKQSAIAVSIGISQGLCVFFQHSHIFAAGDLFRPIWQRFALDVLGHSRILRDLNQGRKMGFQEISRTPLGQASSGTQCRFQFRLLCSL